MDSKKNKFLIKSYKQMFLVIGIFTLVLLVGGTTYAFFNYTRTGSANTLNTGRIYFSTEQTNQNTITLNNIFPMTKEQALADTSTNGTLVVTFTGDTTYTDGIEYLLTIDEVTRTANVPISLIMDVNVESRTAGETPTVTTLTENSNYYTARNTKTTSMYKAEGEDTTINSTSHKVITDIETGKYLLAGYIKSGTDVVNGTVTIKAFIDADNLLITDTPNDQSQRPSTAYTDGTVTTGKTIISTTDWNSLQSTGVSFKVKGEANPGIWVEQQGLAINTLKKLAQPDTGIDFGYISSDNNGKGLYKLGNTDIVYYRGEVDNNNVIFGGFCWQIVRTTDTGGIKMIYNGVVTGDGKTCENTAANDRQLASITAFNSNYTSMSDVGYMYNKRYEISSTKPTTGAYFGSGVSYDDTTNTYTLTGADVTAPDASHHYSCDLTNATGSCATVRYYYYVSGTTYYHINLTGGEKIEDAIYKMTGYGTSEVKARAINQNYELNNTNSTIKTAIDTWYQNNLISYTSYLEDTVYCNDRSFPENGNNTLLKSGWNPNADNTAGNGGLTTNIYFSARTRTFNSWYNTTNIPVFTCPKEEDRFTVSSEKGNGKLTYPIGLLTSDEIVLAGAAGNSTANNDKYYLYTDNYYWGFSPSYFYYSGARGFRVNSTGHLVNDSVTNTYGARPAVSLKSGTEFESGGDGTKTNPYVVKTNS